MDDRVEIGTVATYAEAEAVLGGIDPDVGEMLRGLGSTQVRATGIGGGNIANGSPIGDSPPVLIVLGATIKLRPGAAAMNPASGYSRTRDRAGKQPGHASRSRTVSTVGARASAPEPSR